MLPEEFSLGGFLYTRNPGVNLQTMYRLGAGALMLAAVSLAGAAIMWH